ncbi:MAG: hypothetical protein E7147_03820 [Rikenellaceae bacterium]|nr:hypothetical protein [Rikenellaceae bacterium]
MKNFTKLLMVVALLASYSCTQDVTTDLDQNVGSGQGEMVTLSATLPSPEARTELGAKVGNVYPLYWSEGDVVSVNGYAAGVEIVSGNRKLANLSVPAALETPYHLVYPWVEGVEPSAKVGYSPVVFQSVQAHTEGSFAQGSAPMYGYTNGFENITLKHLTTVLRVEVKAKAGETVNLSYLTVGTVDGTPISGLFDVDCSNGAMVPRSSASSTILYDFGEGGCQLTDAQSSVFYIAVPQGTYEGFEINFIADNGAVMTKSFSGLGSKKLVAGKVREFPCVEFEAGSSMFLISNDAELLDFAAQMAAGGIAEDGALLVADIDMTDKAWTPIDLAGKVFDGNNKWIKGLTVPLFDNVSAEVRNLNVESNIVATNMNYVGAICNSVAGGSITNCSTEGTLTFSNNEHIGALLSDIAVGGVAGNLSSGSLANCRNKMDIVIASGAATGLMAPSVLSVGGVVGAVDSDSAQVTDCENHAELKIEETSGSITSSYAIGGVAGSVLTAADFSNCYNYGALVQATPVSSLYMGGVAGYSPASINKCENRGSLTARSQAEAYNIGGITALAMSMLNNANYGAISTVNLPPVEGAEFGARVLRIGGVAAYATMSVEDNFSVVSDESAVFENNKNYGTIRSLASTLVGEVMCIGGVVGEANLPISNCYNYHSGDDEKSADIYVGGTLVPATIAGIGGVVGSTTDETNDISNIYNYGNIELHYTLGTDGQPIYQAGLVARAHGDVGNSANHGNLLIAVDCRQSTTGTLTYAGCIDYASSGKLMNLTNKGEVRYTGKTSYRVKFGGIARYVDGTSAIAMENCVNDGDLIYAGLSVNTAYVGGLVQDCDMSMTNCHNNGDIIFDQRGAVSGSAQVAGLMDAISGSNNAVYDGCSVTGDIIIACVLDTALYCGGFFYNIAEGCTVQNCELKGNIHITSTAITGNKGDFIGGYFSSVKTKNVSLLNCYNSGDIIFEGMANAKGVTMASFSANNSADATNCVIRDCINEGNIVFKGKSDVQSTSVYMSAFQTITAVPLVGSTGNINRGSMIAEGRLSNHYYVGGCVASYRGATGNLEGFTNEGLVTVTGKTDTNVYLGGVAAYVNLSLADGEAQDGTGDRVTNCHNKGEVRSEAVVAGNVYLGGVAGFTTMKCSPIYNCTNSGLVHLGGRVLGGDNAVGGIAGIVGAAVANCSNSGTIEVQGSLDFQPVVGGIAGGILRSATTTAACEGNENTGSIMAGKSTSVGAITGVSRSVVQMLNSKVGGKVERNNVVTELTEQNYMDYIYGEKWSGDETEPAYDGATFVAPVLPEGGEGTEGSGDNTDGTV